MKKAEQGTQAMRTGGRSVPPLSGPLFLVDVDFPHHSRNDDGPRRGKCADLPRCTDIDTSESVMPPQHRRATMSPAEVTNILRQFNAK